MTTPENDRPSDSLRVNPEAEKEAGKEKCRRVEGTSCCKPDRPCKNCFRSTRKILTKVLKVFTKPQSPERYYQIEYSRGNKKGTDQSSVGKGVVVGGPASSDKLFVDNLANQRETLILFDIIANRCDVGVFEIKTSLGINEQR
jgi:hypothetical protein